MTLGGLFFRFLIYYLGLMFLAALVVAALGIQSKTGINMGILAGVTVLMCSTYAKKNDRRISGNEKSKVVSILAVGNLLVQMLGALTVIDEPALLQAKYSCRGDRLCGSYSDHRNLSACKPFTVIADETRQSD